MWGTDDDSRSCLCLGVANVLRFRILEGVVDEIILTRVLLISKLVLRGGWMLIILIFLFDPEACILRKE